jgi:hypothetical protein
MIKIVNRGIAQYTGTDEDGAEIVLEIYNPAGVGPAALHAGDVVYVGLVIEKHEDREKIDFVLHESDDRHEPDTVLRYHKLKELFEFNAETPDADHTIKGIK